MLSDILREGVEKFPSKPAIYYQNKEMTYLELEKNVARFAHSLLYKLNIKQGDTIAIQSANTIEYVISLFACWRVGAVVTPMNPALKAEEITYQLEHSNAKTIIFQGDCADKVWEAVSRIESFVNKVIFEGEPTGDEHLFYSLLESEEIPPEEVNMELLALIIYTSGTTGKPKGVMLSHRNSLAMMQMISRQLKLSIYDRSYLILPLFHVNSIHFTLGAPILKGASVVLTNRFDSNDFFRNVVRYKPTYTVAVPTIYKMLADVPEEVIESYDLKSLRYAMCGAAPMSLSLFQKVEEKYSFKIIEGWGLSEGTTVSTNNPLKGKRKIGSIGVPLPGQQVKVVNQDGEEMKTGEIGELIVRGENVMKGYLNNKEETEKVIKNDWLYTGDLGYKDEDGYFYITGRKKEVIIRGGINIYPKQIEEVIYEHPAVAEAAVIGIPDEKYGEEVAAMISIQKGFSLSSDEMIEFCKMKLANYKCPKHVSIVDELPKNSMGKINKNKLKYMLKKSVN